MEPTHGKHWQFLEDELIAELQVFEKKFTSRAQNLLLEKEEMFVGQFVGFRGGEMLIKFPNTRTVPRKRDYLYCMLLPAELRIYKNWGDRTYEDLYSQRFKGTEAVCVWHSSSDDSRCTLAGFSEVGLDFAEIIKGTPGIILVFAPQRPPIEYLVNLQKVIECSASPDVDKIILPKHQRKELKPTLVTDNEPDEFIYERMHNSDAVILQGPPGTGKTYLIAQLCKRFVTEGLSVLVTALTNRALMEVAEKPSIRELLDQGLVGKTNLTANERNEIPALLPLTDVEPKNGMITLASYFKSSHYASEMKGESKFDVVIMDEASQAFTAMFAAACKMGRKNLWVGDTKQMAPVVELNKERILKDKYVHFIEGMQYVADYLGEPVYQLTATRRFGLRATSFTGIFYDNTLTTRVADRQYRIPQSLASYLNLKGGPVLIKRHMNVGDLKPYDVIQFIVYIVKEFVAIDPDKEIAVLTHRTRTANAIQVELARNGLDKRNIIAETVARVQGLTTDVVIYLVVNSSYMFSLEPKLFNVATSRAREHTIIIADNNLISSDLDENVFLFINSIYNCE